MWQSLRNFPIWNIRGNYMGGGGGWHMFLAKFFTQLFHVNSDLFQRNFKYFGNIRCKITRSLLRPNSSFQCICVVLVNNSKLFHHIHGRVFSVSVINYNVAAIAQNWKKKAYFMINRVLLGVIFIPKWTNIFIFFHMNSMLEKK